MMNKCIQCNHESNDDVTDYITHDRENRQLHHWFCTKCRHYWFIFDKNKDDEDVAFDFSLKE